jgi:hypothetical protein
MQEEERREEEDKREVEKIDLSVGTGAYSINREKN